MAMENKRIIQLSTERTNLTSGDYVMVDSDADGSAKYRLDRLKETDTTLSVSGKAADAAATGQAISDETTARENADTALGDDIDDLKSAIEGDEDITKNLYSYDIAHLTATGSTITGAVVLDGEWRVRTDGAFGGGNFIIEKYPAKPLYKYIARGVKYKNCAVLTFADINGNILDVFGYDSEQGYFFTGAMASGTAPLGTAFAYVLRNDTGYTSCGEYIPVIYHESVTGYLRCVSPLVPHKSVKGCISYRNGTLQLRTDGSYEGWTVEKYFVFPGEKYTIYGEYININPFAVFVSSSLNFTTIWEDPNNTHYSVQYMERTVTVPDGVTEIWVNRYTTHSAVFSTIYPHKISYKDIYRGITWYCIGDSITEYNGTASKKYYDYVQEKTGIHPLSVAVGGRGYVNGGDTDDDRFYQQALKVPANTDVITIFGGGNDLTSYDIGNVDDTGTDTICGCVNKTIDNIYSVNPVAKFGIITPCPWYAYPVTNPSNKMALLSEAIVTICKNRGVPCLDLYHCSGMRPWENDFKSLIYTRSNNDGIHPNEIGHKMMASHIEQFVKTILVS